jgi:hypothetical protein
VARLRKELSIFGALFVALLTVTAIDMVYLMTMGKFIFLSGIPTPGGAPVSIHVFNFGIKGGWAALAYGLVMRFAFGRVHPMRVALLWAVGLALVALLGSLAAVGVVGADAAFLIGLAVYLAVGQFVARDWVSR